MQQREASRLLKTTIRAVWKKNASAQCVYHRAFAAPDDALPFLTSAYNTLTARFREANHESLQLTRAALDAKSEAVAEMHEKYLAGDPTGFTRRDLGVHIAAVDGFTRALDRYRLTHTAGRFERVLTKGLRGAAVTGLVLLFGGTIAGLVYGLSLPAYDEGLTGNYFSNPHFKGPSYQSVDHQVDFNWDEDAPIKGLPRNRFSIRWEGCIRVDQSKGMFLAAAADDDVRIYVKGDLLIDTRGTKTEKTVFSRTRLKKGLYPIEIQYRDLRGPAHVFFAWSPDAKTAEPVPASNLLPRNVVIGGAGANAACPRMPKLKEPEENP